jgi:hypothetical protein
MILKDDGEIVSTSEESDCDDMPPLEDASDLEYAVGDKVLVIRQSLNVQTKEDNMGQQRENNFLIRCLINDKVCSMIIDSGSCTNVASVTLVVNLYFLCLSTDVGVMIELVYSLVAFEQVFHYDKLI